MKIQTDPFRTSVMAQSAAVRAFAVVLLLAVLWGAIAWAVALP